MVRRARYMSYRWRVVSLQGRLAYVKEDKMTSGGVVPLRLSKSIEPKFNVSGTQPKVDRARGRF